MKLDSTFKVPLKINLASQKTAIEKDGYLNITLKAGMKDSQIAKAFFYLSFKAFWLGIKHLLKRNEAS